VEPPTKEELEQAVKVLKHSKVPGLDEKPSKLWRSRPQSSIISFDN
jgi:hypothetical protein